MSTKEPIVIHGQSIGRLKASWLLFKETFRFLRADPEVVAVPLVVGVFHIFLIGLVIFVYALAAHQGVVPESDELKWVDYGFVFVLYILSALAVAITNAVIAYIVAVRATGGNATLSQGFRATFSRFGPLFVWSFITATVGIILRTIAERSHTIGRIVIMIVGVAWAVLTYFVIQAIMLEGHSVPKSIKRSGQVFRSVWGEVLVTNFSFRLVFLFIYLAVFMSWIGLTAAVIGATGSTELIILLVILFVIVFIISLVNSAMNSVLKTLLFIYATNSGTVQGFDPELLDRMLKKNSPVPPSPTSQPIIDAPARDVS